MRGRRWRRAGLGAVATAVAATALLSVVPVVAMPAPEQDVPQWAARTRALPTAGLGPAITRPRLVPVAPPPCYSGSTRESPTPCLYGPESSPRRVAMVLDSHGWAWWPAIAAEATHVGVRVAVFAKTACGAVETTRAYPFPAGLRRYDECPVWQARVAGAIAAWRPGAVVLGSATTVWLPVSDVDLGNVRDQTTRLARWQAGMSAAITRYRGLGLRVLWLGDSPVTTAAALDCASRAGATRMRCGVPAPAGLPPGRPAELATAARRGVPLIDPTTLLCSATWCTSYAAGRPTHRNPGHVAYDWALAAPEARAFWRRVLASV